ncbi:MAG: succinylglutamate desuccinylase/aspartoacylase family protein [Deltaproteobacteria bacterium]|nr:succinylglutamate desuccinylase/aspartoacylase family protein [Deltaproteobacteria bacterium]
MASLLSYQAVEGVAQAFSALASRYGGQGQVAGRSVEGRELWRFDFGHQDDRVVLLTGMIHGVELIGGLALWSSVQAILQAELPIRLVVLPMLNPDGVHHNLRRIEAGRWAARRCNARGVDLNRNFPMVCERRPWHPFSGSKIRWSAHYRGEAELSEPETQTVAQVAEVLRPWLAFGFHSFGNLLLYPWAHTAQPHPRTAEYRAIGEAFCAAQAQPYRLMPAHGLYPIVGDLDDWLDARFQTLAFTVEVSRPGWSLLRTGQALNPFHVMNPPEPEGAVAQVVPGVVAAIRSALGELGARRRGAPVPAVAPVAQG